MLLNTGTLSHWTFRVFVLRKTDPPTRTPGAQYCDYCLWHYCAGKRWSLRPAERIDPSHRIAFATGKAICQQHMEVVPNGGQNPCRFYTPVDLRERPIGGQTDVNLGKPV
jgi:hypothetical protein